MLVRWTATVRNLARFSAGTLTKATDEGHYEIKKKSEGNGKIKNIPSFTVGEKPVVKAMQVS